jgi:hypothetical protein
MVYPLWGYEDRGALHEDYRTEKSRRGCVGKAWVPKRIPWRVSLLAARIISVLLSHFFAKGYHRKGVFLSFLLR